MKMGRDFVTRDDFERIMIDLLEAIDPSLLDEIDYLSNDNAYERAHEYKEFLRTGQDGSKIYKDLINLEEDD